MFCLFDFHMHMQNHTCMYISCDQQGKDLRSTAMMVLIIISSLRVTSLILRYYQFVLIFNLYSRVFNLFRRFQQQIDKKHPKIAQSTCSPSCYLPGSTALCVNGTLIWDSVLMGLMAIEASSDIIMLMCCQRGLNYSSFWFLVTVTLEFCFVFIFKIPNTCGLTKGHLLFLWSGHAFCLFCMWLLSSVSHGTTKSFLLTSPVGRALGHWPVEVSKVSFC